MLSDTSPIDSLDFKNFINRGALIESNPNVVYSVSPTSDFITSITSGNISKIRESLDLNMILKIALVCLIIYGIYRYFKSNSFKKTCTSQYVNCVNTKVSSGLKKFTSNFLVKKSKTDK